MIGPRKSMSNPPDITCCEVPYGSARYHEMVALREAVLRRPLGRVLSPEELAAGEHYLHLAAIQNNAVCATVLVSMEDEITARFRQVAVAEAAQGTGIGKMLMVFAHETAKARGAQQALIHARHTAIPFYERLGYVAEGEFFPEHTVPHIIMRRKL